MRQAFLNNFNIELNEEQQREFESGKKIRTWIQIFRPGQWKHPRYGKLQFNDEIFNGFVRNFKDKVRGVELAIDQEHQPEKGAAAWVVDLENRGSGNNAQGLWALVEWTKWGFQLVSDGVFKYLSGDFDYEWIDEESGKKFKNVLFGAALTNRPFIKGMSPVNLSEFKDELENNNDIRNSFKLAEDILKLKEEDVAKTDEELMKMKPEDMTPEEKKRHEELMANKKKEEEEIELSKKKQLAERAKKCGLLETATLSEVEAKEKQLADEIKIKNENLLARAKAVGLPENATEEQILQAEKKAASDKEAELAKNKALAERAKAIGLSEKSTEAEIVAKEKELSEKKAKEEADKISLSDIPAMEKKLSEMKDSNSDPMLIRLMEENIAKEKKLAENKLNEAKGKISTMLKEHFRSGKITVKERDVLSAVLCADVDSVETSFRLSEKDKDGKDVEATKTLFEIVDMLLKDRPAIVELKDLAEKQLKEPPKPAGEDEKELSEVGKSIAQKVAPKATKQAKKLAEEKTKK